MLLKEHFAKGEQTLEQALNNHLAYHCGRLFAVIERIQTRASRELNTTVVERYFRSVPEGIPFSLTCFSKQHKPHLYESLF